ncbi:MAG: hypothetical protein KDA80_19950 [Planctomycetaceae bacterium]|nr:hypothetical protein [Planctomycetaceae bacterium]
MAADLPPHDNPFETPRPAGTSVVQGILRVTVAIQCFGLAVARWHQGRQTPFSAMLAQGKGWTTEQVAQFENGAAMAMAIIGVTLLFRPSWLTLMPVLVFQAGIATATVVMEHGPHPLFSSLEQAVALAAPLALLLIDFWPPGIRPNLVLTLSAMALLRLATVITFVTQGILALLQFRSGGSLTKVIIQTAQNVAHREVTEAQAQLALGVIGVVQIALAFSLLMARSKASALWMAIVGLLSAASRTLAFGMQGYDLSLLRFAEAGVPFVLLMFWLLAYQEQPAVILPDRRDMPPSR